MKKISITLGVVLFLAFSLVDARADTLVQSFTRADYNDLAVWPAQDGANGPSMSTTSTNGVGVTGSNSNGVTIFTQSSYDSSGNVISGTWDGNFLSGDSLLYSPSMMEIDLSTGVSGIGTQVSPDFYSVNAIARIAAYNGSTLLGFLTGIAPSFSGDNNGAIFLGLIDLDGANINRLLVSLDYDPTGNYDFAINQVSLLSDARQPNHNVPEPASMFLLGVGIAGLAGLKLKRKSAN